MGEKRNFAALDWVIGEISDTLKEARQSLEAYVEDPKDSTRIRFCLTHIHQVHGSLQMVEFHGAALLAEEMEHTAQAIMDNSVVSIPESQEVLMRGLLQLPLFLDHIKSAREDNPALVMPLLNDLRAVRKQSYLSETNLFSPDLSSVDTIVGQKHAVVSDKAKLLPVLKKLREMYQFAAASVLRGIKVEQNLDYLDKVFSRLELLAQGTASYPVWEVSAALIDGLKRDEIELTVAVRGLLRYIARELRILGEKAPAAFDIKPSEPLLKNLLFYVARAEEGSQKVAKVKQKYGLNQALVGSSGSGGDSDDMLSAPDAEAIRSVVVALQDELASVKRVLDLSLSGQGTTSDLKEILPTVKRISDTLAVLGIGDLRKNMLAQSESLEKLSQANSIDEPALMETASNIIDIEHRLKAIANSAGKRTDLSNVNEREVEIDNAKAAVIKECAAGLQKSKEAIIDYISSQWDKQYLENVDAMLGDIRGGLGIIPLHRPAAIVDSCARFIRESLLEIEEHPSFQTLESLADAMASVEYYLERLMENLYEDSDSMLDIAEESVANLGFSVRQEEADLSSDVEVSEAALPEVEEKPSEPEVDIEAPVEAEKTETFEPASLGAHFVEETEAASGEQPEEKVEEATVAAEPEQSAGLQMEPVEPIESDIDDEIIEIFIEEAGEVLETLEEFFPLWKATPTDDESLTVVRRAFHTLKGSGRMVEAFDIGELAWSIENMLNRVIDKTITIQPHVFHIIDAVIALVPELVKAFENRHTNPYKTLTQQYEGWAHQISEGNFPEELAEPIPLFNELTSPAAEAVSEVSDETEQEPAQEEQAPEAEPEAQVEQVETVEEDVSAAEDDSGVDNVLQEIFSQESVTHLETIDDFIRRMAEDSPIYSVPSDALQRAMHTLKGSAKMAQVWPIAEITEPLENFAKELIAFQVPVNDDILQLISDAAEYIREGLALIESGQALEIPKMEQFVARTEELRELAVGDLASAKASVEESDNKVDPRMLSLVMAEEMALLLEADQLLKQWQQQGSCSLEVDRLLAELSTLEEGALAAKLNDMAQLSQMLRNAYEKALAKQIPTDDAFFSQMHQGHDALLDMVDAVAAGQNVVAPPAALLTAIRSLIAKAAPLSLAEPAEEQIEAPVNDTVAEEEPPLSFEYSEDAGPEIVVDLAPSNDEDLSTESGTEAPSVPDQLADDSTASDSEEEITFEFGGDEAEDDRLEDDALDEAYDFFTEAVREEEESRSSLADTENEAQPGQAHDESVAETLNETALEPNTEVPKTDETEASDELETGDIRLDDSKDESELSHSLEAEEADDGAEIQFEGSEIALGDIAESDITPESASEELSASDTPEIQFEGGEIDLSGTAESGLLSEPLAEELSASDTPEIQFEGGEIDLSDTAESGLLSESAAEELSASDAPEIQFEGGEIDLSDTAESGLLSESGAEELSASDAPEIQFEGGEIDLSDTAESDLLSEPAAEELSASDTPEIQFEGAEIDLSGDDQNHLASLSDLEESAEDEGLEIQFENIEPSVDSLELNEEAMGKGSDESVSDELPAFTAEGPDYLSGSQIDDQPVPSLEEDLSSVASDGTEEDLIAPLDPPEIDEIKADEGKPEDLGSLEDLTFDFSSESESAPDIEAPEEVVAEEISDPVDTLEPLPESEPDTPPPPSPAMDTGVPVIPGLLDTIDINSEDFDTDILEVFLEEADELVEGMDEAIHSWESNWTDGESLEEIKRILHTLKGGARLAGLANFGDLTHDYETMLIEVGSDLSNVDEAFFAEVHNYQDRTLSAVRAVKTFADGDYEIATGGEPATEDSAEPESPAPAEIDSASPEGVLPSDDISPDEALDAALTPSEQGDDSGETPEQQPTEASEEAQQPEADSASNVVQFAPKPKPEADTATDFSMPSVTPAGPGGGPAQAAAVALKKAGPQEVVKVSAELLEELVNLAGETSINRSRLEQYVNDFGFALDEVDSTLNRLQDQLRRLDMETEAQILFRQEQMEAHEDFDPLEMDRYSHLQQLSRSLIESASDLMDLKSDLGDRLKVTETLLLQQSRINTTLQEGLMRSRMVPFSRLVPRLRRIVRQVSSELGKNVSFELDNVEGELDRSVLERMVPPFEHMLRNAVDHGIESPEDRINAGKSETGRIVLTLAREGGDVIIRLADDGKGIDLKRVREKAIERELMSEGAELSDHDIMQFILHAGFSTAESVTQISGRGVGMDVVSAEIKQLGGSVTINSAWGKGTEFVIRLPFTLSVNRALMVAIGKDNYAVPLSSIEGIVRVSPFELEHYYDNPEAQFEYANENYHVRYLGSLLHAGLSPSLEGHVLPLPVLLVRSAEHTMALQVDAVMGSREIVVKSLGQQFSAVAGLSGATVMGDGSVVVILDPHALVRNEIARATLQLEHEEQETVAEQEEETRVRRIMVVDDSVTVRKVTTRFLEREGFEVITAKDGVDALRVLQDGLPDLMLLDIEMPRMDGFEVAKTVRSTQRWEALPIIMITSRTGDKHREHALSLGVNNYLGKPYQEDILLEAIGEILDEKSVHH